MTVVPCTEIHLAPRTGMKVVHLTSGAVSRAENDWGRVPEHWGVDVDDRATFYLLNEEDNRRRERLPFERDIEVMVASLCRPLRETCPEK